MSDPIKAIIQGAGMKEVLTLRELMALEVLMDSGEMKELCDSLFKTYMETANCTEEEAKATCGPFLLTGIIVRAKELAKEIDPGKGGESLA